MAYYLLVLIFFIGMLPNPDISGSWMLTRALMSMLLIPLIFYKKIRLPANDKFKYLLIFLGYICIRSLFSLNVFLSIENLLWFMLLFFIYIVFLNSFKKRDWRYILYFSSFVAFIAILSRLNITDFFLSYIKNKMIIKDRSWRSAVDLWFFNSNYLCAFFLFSSLRGFFFVRKVKKINFYLVLNLIGIIACGSESAMIAYLFCYAASIFYKRQKVIYVFALVSVLIILSVIILWEDTYTTLLHRKLFFTNALLQFFDNPIFGSGPGHFVIFFNRYLDASLLDIKAIHLPPSLYVHNDLLQMLCETGIIGFSLILLCIFFLFRSKNKRVIFFFSCYLIFSSMNHALYFERGMLMFVLMLSTLNIKTKSMTNNIFIRLLIVSIIIVSLIIASTNIIFAFSKDTALLEKALLIRPGNYFSIVELASLYNNNKEYRKALSFYEKAKKINPYNPLLYKNLSIVRINLLEYDKALNDIYDEYRYSVPKDRFEIAIKGMMLALRFNNDIMLQRFKELADKSTKNVKEKKKLTEILKKIEKQ